jgi:signal transduction histidine kinase
MSALAALNSPVPLESVICTEELNLRESRSPEPQAVTHALIELAQTMANSPERILQKLVDTALSLCRAHSAGLSLLEEENGRKIFRWHGVAGVFAPHLWGTTPREFSPCGTVLDTDKVQLMSYLDRHFAYFAKVEPRIAEALLVPFHVDGEAVGTVWVISHDDEKLKFDAEDAKVLNTLGEFAAAAYKALSGTIALKSIVATIREPLLVLDRDLLVKSASRSFFETFQVTAEQTEGRFLWQLGNGQWNLPELLDLLRGILSEGVVDNYEITHNFPSLGPRVMSLNARKLWSEGNPESLILLAIDDITTRKQIEEGLLRSNEDAQLFAYVAAHDLRAPLNTSVALLQLLKDKTELEDEDRRVLSMATTSLERLQGLMNDILSYAQVGDDQRRASVCLNEPLDIALANLRNEIEEAGARIDHGHLPTVNADRSQMVLVFQNLIANSIKFRSSNPPLIEIRAARENRQFVISIADNGQGFDPKYAAQIFLPFKRLHHQDTPGSGIGLASCKRRVERQGGRIWAEAEPGKGATFYFSVPDTETNL